MSTEGGDIRPYREACDGVSLCGLGPLWTHIHSSGSHTYPTYGNTTTVPNPAGGDPIPPYERWTPDPGGAASCDIHFCGTDPGAAPCTAWPQTYPAQTFISTGTNVSFDVCHKQGFKNVQARRSWHGVFGWISTDVVCPDHFCSDGTTSYRGYQEAPDQTKYLTVTVDITNEYHEKYDYDDVQYGTATVSGSRSVDSNSGEITSSLISAQDDYYQYAQGVGGALLPAVQTKHISGGAGYTATYSVTDGGTPSAATHQDSITSHASGMATMLDAAPEAHCTSAPLLPYGSFTWRGAGYTEDWIGLSLISFVGAWNSYYSGTPDLILPAVTDPNSYSDSVTFTDTSGETTSLDISWSRSATSFTFALHYQDSKSPSDGLPEAEYNFHGSITLSNPNTAGTVYADITNNLLVLWPLNDDALYPWRTDLKVSLSPLVSRNEIAGAVSPIEWNPYTVDDLESPIDDGSGNTPFSTGWTPTYDQRAWFDPAVYQWTFAAGTDQTNSAATGLLQLFDGSILGAPLPAGYQSYFNFAFQDWRGCCYRPIDDPGFQAWADYQVGWGQTVATFNSNSGCGLPLNATQWNNWVEGVNKPAGAWIIYADKADYFPGTCHSSSPDATAKAFDAGQIVACKWAEVLEMWNSQNFARPAGDDKFVYDENRVYCATNFEGSGAGSVWTLIDPLTGIAPPDSTDFTGYWGGPSVGGFYSVDSYSAGEITLGAQVYDVPSNWASKSNADDASCFGKLRYPTYPALLGRVAITPAGLGTANFVFTVPQPNFGLDDATHTEQVDLYDARMTLVASDATATRIDDSNFSTMLDPGSAGSQAVWATIHGVSWYVNDTRPKGDYAVLQWWSDFRTYGENVRLTGVLDCSGVQVTQPTANRGGGDVTNLFRDFSQTEHDCLPFLRCDPRVVCISPNSETFPNGATYAFPETFEADEQYGAKWWGYVQQTMTDLFWQQPHRPCNIEPCAGWQMDGGICADNNALSCPAYCCPGDPDYDAEVSQAPEYFYSFTPLVEARVTLPTNYGMGQDETAPDLPADVSIGWLSPVDHSTGDVAFPPLPPGPEEDTGVPGGATLSWDVHTRLCFYNPTCRFDYSLPACSPPS